MRKFGLIGYPLGHSFSQKYFAGKFEREKIEGCTYENFPIRSITELPALIKRYPDLCGLNVTIPYKSEILDYVDYTEDSVDQIGAANVLKIKRPNDKIFISAFNSDVNGIKDSLIPCARGTAKKAIILGTGGSSKAVVWALRKMGCEITLVSRNPKPGILGYDDLDQGIMETTDVIINTTPLGMFPDIESRPEIDYNLLNEKHVLFDLVYNPEITEFLKKGKERGCRIITGMKMLRSQADRSWEIWNDENL